MDDHGQPGVAFHILLWVALLGAVVAELSGFHTSRVLAQQIWSPSGWKHFIWYTLIFTGISAGLFFKRQYFVPLLLGFALLGTWIAVGPVALGAVLLFVFSATILGQLIFGRDLDSPLACLAGMGAWILVMSLAARFPIHYRAIYLCALALPLAIGYPMTRRLAGTWLHWFRPTPLFRLSGVPSAWEFISASLVAFVGVAHWLMVLKPEVSADGLAMHLATASNIAIHHAFTIDFRQFVWALMPMGADWCYSVVYVLGGEYAARLLNFAMLGLVGLLLFGAARQWLSKALAAFMVFLFLSTPMVQHVTGSMFVENFVAAMGLGAAVALWKFQQQKQARWLLLTAFLLGTFVALKLGALAVAALMTLFVAVVMWRNRRQVKRPAMIGAIALLIIVGAVPYMNAHVRSGNPIFPFENAYFHSPYYANENQTDSRYLQPATWRTPLLLTFRTSRYFEGQNGSFGLQYFLLLPLTLVCFAAIRSFAGRSAIVIGLGSAIVIAVALPNARYFYPTLPFLTLGAAAALARVAHESPRIFHASMIACTAAGLLNIYLLPASGSYHKDFYSLSLLSDAGRQAYVKEQAPIRELVAYVNRVDRIHPVVITDSSGFAGLIAPVYSFHWHNFVFQEEVRSSQDAEQLYRLLARLNVRRLLVAPNSEREKSMEILLAKCGGPEFSFSGYAVVDLRSDCPSKLVTAEPPPLNVGMYDETDPRITFLGNWTEKRDLPFAYHQTVAFTDRAGAQVRFRIKGRGFRYAYTGAYNRGIAEILVDGMRERTVDLYSPTIVWQAQVLIGGLAPGIHNITIRALPERNPGATGHFIDIDSIDILDDTAAAK